MDGVRLIARFLGPYRRDFLLAVLCVAAETSLELFIPILMAQVVVNQPTVFKKATIAEKLAADKFNAEQKEAIRSMADEDEDFDESNDSERR